MNNPKLLKWLGVFFLVLLVNTAYVWAFAFPTVFYMTNVLFHLGLGTVLFLVLLWLAKSNPGLRSGLVSAIGLFGVAFVLGGWLTVQGNVAEQRWALYGHVAAALVGVAFLFPWAWRKARELGGGWVGFRKGLTAAAALVVLLPPSVYFIDKAFPHKHARIANPLTAPTSMQEEGAGPKSPFFPSSANTNVDGIIPANFFMDSEACGECHKDAYEQWKGSMHHFASFNNQFYRKSIEYMQSVVGTQPTKWCAGCHDHAVFFNGRFDKPIKDQMDTPEAHAGLACTSCHSIVKVGSTMGNGDFLIEYPPLHELMTSKNKYIKWFNHFLTNLNPEPHKRSFIKPFMNKDQSEYCSSCHKVHLDVPVNDWRWFRGFNDYDNWQASGVSGQGARSFYYPKESSTCVDCHMPLVDSKDPATHKGKLHSHRFPAANTAVPTANKDHEQLASTTQFLKSGFISVDIFAASPVNEKDAGTKMIRRMGDAPQAMSGIAAGEETEQSGAAIIREVGKIAAPLDAAAPKIQPGATVRVDVVVRTRKIGHFFPGGTVDAFDIWLELQAKDATGKLIYWSGYAEDEGRGPVEPGAHFYKSLQLDGEGNPINKRNAWQARSVLYTRMIPPGAADVAHYLMRIPKDVKGPITLTAKLNHRKFTHYYTQFAYAGQPKPGQESQITKTHNSAEYSFDKANIPANVSGKIKDEIPVLPTIVLATATSTLQIGDAKTETQWTPVVDKKHRERWNDWGIGLLLQGDLKAAEYAFTRVTEAEPEYADGWLNVARALIQEGETDAAKPFIAKALAVNPKLGRIYYFKSLAEKTDGDYDAAMQSLNTVIGMYPRDRVVLNQLARIQFLKRDYTGALKTLERVCGVDPEDLQMHYTAMLCYRGLGKTEEAAREQKLFQRFKAEEASQAITAKRRLLSPEDNNERQMIHDHESISLDKPKAAKPAAPKGPAQVTKKQAPKAAEAAGGGSQ
jgi:tetratricopeptide (TPR) repeat protein